MTAPERTWFADERHAEVLRLLATEHRVESAGLARHFGVSAESIRKDLAQLEARGLLRRVHGGAVPSQRQNEERAVVARTEYAEQKMAIAKHALRLVPDGGALLLDAGSTTLRLAELLPADRGLVVYTNAIPLASVLLQRGIAVISLGGRLRPETGAAVGPLTVAALGGINVDVAFLGTNALSFDRGLTTPDADEALVKHAMLAAARQRVFLVDRSKFGRESLAKHADLDDVDVLVTDAAISAQHRRRLLARDVAVEVAR
ncbi:DeoR/GlpR family DNA-binding transcription regulator [Mycobacterium deserti]|uniref:Lactose phosphotransferase system repressor n=1 Tax=Mycobacterium deserti TaxID=2978347 RepID=A0ABT2MAT8_9MYCO|nr:DeoR/GlpR family DNA-binding transcription regulator [Mycobacterium deserti]MCT7659383.1 DeoR/GlpR family DNA-binding transcription regulator [Mycobacterium deserti]